MAQVDHADSASNSGDLDSVLRPSVDGSEKGQLSQRHLGGMLSMPTFKAQRRHASGELGSEVRVQHLPLLGSRAGTDFGASCRQDGLSIWWLLPCADRRPSSRFAVSMCVPLTCAGGQRVQQPAVAGPWRQSALVRGRQGPGGQPALARRRLSVTA